MLKKQVQIVDEQPLFRAGLADIVAGNAYMSVTGDAANAHQAVRMMRDRKPHIAIVSVSLPGIHGGALAQLVRSMNPACNVVLIVRDEALNRMAHFANDYRVQVFPRSVDPVTLRSFLTAIAADKSSPEPNTLPAISSPANVLSPRELEVLDCVVMGYSNREIASELFLTEQTIKNHLTSVLRKLHASDRMEAMLTAVDRGWVNYREWDASSPDQNGSQWND